MSKICKVTIDGERIFANRGDLLLDAALMNGIELPHDCRAGYCGTCQVRIVAGRCLATPTGNPGTVRACQTRVLSDLRVVVEKIPEETEVFGNIVDLIDVAPDVWEICVESPRPMKYLPGQYLSVRFRGFPARYYSPTVPLDWPSNPDLMRFHVRQIPKGRVSAALGRKIKKGHRVRLKGPFGTAYFRPRHRGRLVLLSSGTGFAPIWAIAEAAIREKPNREVVLITGAREVQSLYMIPALCRLALFPHVTIIPTAQQHQSISPAVQQGQPTDYLPPLSVSDVIYVAGGAGVVRATARMAAATGTPCFTDPFLPAAEESAGKTLMSHAAKWFVGAA